MVAAARERGIDAQLADVVDWMPDPGTDVVITNAVLHWVPEHPRLLSRWLGALPAGAWFTMQVPGNLGAPSHALVRELLTEPRWLGRVELRGEETVPEPAEYAELLSGSGADVDVWETTYLHRLTGEDPVLTWISATALRPVRDALPADDYAAFRTELAPRLRAAYPRRPDGTTWFPFRRIFAVARTT
jgi:trans-aconitate 2-methyltransferase